MGHMLEKTELGYALAYAGEVPWHGQGTLVPSDLSPVEMLKAAQLDWEVQIVPGFYTWKNENHKLGRSALIRLDNDRLLDHVSDEWKPVQNHAAAEFFSEFVREGEMEMHTAGSIRDGEVVWFLAKMRDEFTLFGRDRVEAFLLFTNPHQYGWSTDIRFTPTRVVCNNTLTLALGDKTAEKIVRVSHRDDFKPEVVKETLGIARQQLEGYRQRGLFLGAKRYQPTRLVEYFKELFPNTSRDADRKVELSRPASVCLDLVEKQPGAEFAPGTWWNGFNSATFYVDHLMGKTDAGRLDSAWYGQGRKLKNRALTLALQHANA